MRLDDDCDGCDGCPAAPGRHCCQVCGGALVNRVDYSAAFWFPVTPDRLWAVVEQFDLFESWWGWLREFEADQGELVDGNVLHGTVVPPVPYHFHLDVQLQRCRRPRLIDAVVNGDLSGQAVLRLEHVDDGTRVAVAWSLEMRSAPLRVAARVAYPLMRWGHDRVVDMAVSGFQRRALLGVSAVTGPG